ncbi:disease resistance protein RGA5-like [Triticum urartu]|uniref:disease resistance protein RGA5-like n=1 Tax=Triticum urartu TaxID=4572 RepID=UPI002044C7BD|nr:disease resistance protein RGA5-like [Triticum urartu]
MNVDRYFIVIDDIWDTEIWDIIRCTLMHNNCASRIIATTRILEVARIIGEVYKLEPLSHDLSKDLFNTRLFGGKKKCHYDPLINTYHQFLHKCGGVPLTITTIASLLVGKPMEYLSKVYRSIGFKYEDNTRTILLLSYYDLPCHLRTCLLYLSIYPEYRIIEKDSLIWKWIAEGFVHDQEPGVGLYAIGERYFDELIDKSMIQPCDFPTNKGMISGCRVHDMVHDMICLLAKEENFVTILDSNEQHINLVHRSVRWLAIGDKIRLANIPMPQVRSLNDFNNDVMLPSLSCFQVLRVLALEGGAFSQNNNICLENLGKLVHLRYLGLGKMVGILELPKGIGDLKFLQTLDLGCDRLRELPRSVGLLRQLKCLRAYGKHIIMPDWIGSLTSLQELWVSQVHESSNFMNELGKLTELRKLRTAGTLWLFGASSMKAWKESLVKLKKIQTIDMILVMSMGYDDSTCCWEGYIPPQQFCLLYLWYNYEKPGWGGPIDLALLDPSHLSMLVETEIFGRFPELVTLHLNMPRGHQCEIMGAEGALPKLRVYKSATSDHIPKERFSSMPSIESLDFHIEVRVSSDSKVDYFDFGSLRNLPLLQSIPIDTWSSRP